MSKARALSFELIRQAPSDDELTRRQQAAELRTGLIGDLDGHLLEPPPIPSQAPRVAAWADQETID